MVSTDVTFDEKSILHTVKDPGVPSKKGNDAQKASSESSVPTTAELNMLDRHEAWVNTVLVPVKRERHLQTMVIRSGCCMHSKLGRDYFGAPQLIRYHN